MKLTTVQAKNQLHDRVFNGNKVEVEFYDEEKFNQGIYE
jgi:hypothetical protein